MTLEKNYFYKKVLFWYQTTLYQISSKSGIVSPFSWKLTIVGGGGVKAVLRTASAVKNINIYNLKWFWTFSQLFWYSVAKFVFSFCLIHVIFYSFDIWFSHLNVPNEKWLDSLKKSFCFHLFDKLHKRKKIFTRILYIFRINLLVLN